MGALGFIGCGYLVLLHGKPLQMAGLYVFVTSVLSLIFGASFLSLLVAGAIIYAYTAFVYMVVSRFSDGFFIPVAVLVAGAAILFGATLLV